MKRTGHLSFAEVIHQMPVEELASVIGVEAQDGERQGRFDLSDALGHRRLAPVGHRPRLGPLGMHIGGGNAPAKFSRHALAAMRHRVGFDKARATHLPVLGADGNLTAQQSAGTRAAAATAAQTPPGRERATGRSWPRSPPAPCALTLLSNWPWRFS